MNPRQEIEALQAILDEIVNAVEQTLASGEELPDELQGMIAEEINLTIQRIQQLQQVEQQPPESPEQIEEEAIQQVPSAIPQQIPQLESAPYPSSNINAFKYNPEQGKLFVKFQGKYPQQNGPTYQYSDVPAYIFDIFRRGAVAPKTSGKNAWHTWKRGVTPSHGASMNALLKAGGFQYQKLS